MEIRYLLIMVIICSGGLHVIQDAQKTVVLQIVKYALNAILLNNFYKMDNVWSLTNA